MAQRIIFLDTETTGRSATLGRIVEIAAVEVDDHFRPVRVFHEYIDPQQSVGGSERIHGLSDAFLRGRRTFRDIAADFKTFVRGATVYAHNMPFDCGFIDAELARCGEGRLADIAFPEDTLAWARAKVGSGRASLDKLVDHFGIDGSARSAHHGALIDVELLIQVFLCLSNQREKALAADFSAINAADVAYQVTVAPVQCVEPEEDEAWEDEVVAPFAVRSAGDEYEEKLEAIVQFADEHSWFDGDMYEDMLERYRESGWLSDRQREVIDGIMDRFSIS